MALNSDYYRHIRHALGDAELSSLLSEAEILQQAADWLSSAHPWDFLIRPIRLSVRPSITLSDASYVHATRTLTKLGAFASYDYVAGDRFAASAGTGVTEKSYPIESHEDDDSIVLVAPGLGAAAVVADIDGLIPNDSIALPSDFQAFPQSVPLRSADAVFSRIDLRSREVLTAARTTTVDTEGNGPWTGCVSELLDPTTGQTVPVLELHPYSSVAIADAFIGYYRAKLVIDATDERAVVAIPQSRQLVHTLLIQACRSFALGYEEGAEVGKPTLELMLENLMTSQLWRAAKRQDGLGHSSHLGPLRGGVGERDSRGLGQTRNLVSPPS